MKNIILRYLVLIFFLFSKNIYAQILVSDSLRNDIKFNSWDDFMISFSNNEFFGVVDIQIYDDIYITKTYNINVNNVHTLVIRPYDTCVKKVHIFVFNENSSINFNDPIINIKINGSAPNNINNKIFQFYHNAKRVESFQAYKPIISKKGRLNNLIIENCEFIYDSSNYWQRGFFPILIELNNFNSDSKVQSNIQISNNYFKNTDSTIIINNLLPNNLPKVILSENKIENYFRSAFILNGKFSLVDIEKNNIFKFPNYFKYAFNDWDYSNAIEVNSKNNNCEILIISNRLGNNSDFNYEENSFLKINNLADSNESNNNKYIVNIINNYLYTFIKTRSIKYNFVDFNIGNNSKVIKNINFYNNTFFMSIDSNIQNTSNRSFLNFWLDSSGYIYLQNNLFISNSIDKYGSEVFLSVNFKNYNISRNEINYLKGNIYSNNNLFYSKSYDYAKIGNQPDGYLFNSFSTYQNFIYPQEQNSYNLPITFKDSINPYVSGEFEGYWALAGIPLNYVKEDIDGRPRDPYYPYRGAYEGQKIIHVGIPQVQSMSYESEVFPNPFKNQINIKTHSNQTQSIQLYGIDGKLWLQEEIKGQKEINTEMLPEGMYVCVVGGKAYKMIK